MKDYSAIQTIKKPVDSPMRLQMAWWPCVPLCALPALAAINRTVAHQVHVLNRYVSLFIFATFFFFFFVFFFFFSFILLFLFFPFFSFFSSLFFVFVSFWVFLCFSVFFCVIFVSFCLILTLIWDSSISS